MDEQLLKTARILIVDDEPANVRLLERLLQREGYTSFRSTTDARQVLTLYGDLQPDLILLDLAMPYMDGFQILEQINPLIPSQAFLPILVLTADITLEKRRRALERGAKDFVTKPFDPVEVLLRVRNLLETRLLHLELARHNESLEQTVRERTQQLLQTEKLATMGGLLAGVAHELNNPLTIVIGQAHLLRHEVKDSALVRRAQKIHAAADRCVRIVRNFLALARQHTPERGEVRLNDVVDQAIELLAYELRTGGVEVVFNRAEDLPTLWADAHRLHQVLVNLVVNAGHALRGIPSGRRITLTTRFDPEHARAHLEVSDTGPGISPEIQARIFEPFFTTKPSGQGTGLGLSLCQGIIEEHGGTIRVVSKPRHGATFVIELPVVTPPTASAIPRPAESLPAVNPKTILVVDDEPDIAATLAEMLQGAGHRVEVATDGQMALEMLQRRGYDLIVTDTKMPVLDGLEFYGELERRFPQLRHRVIFVTGDVLDQDKRNVLAATGALCLAKPFDLDEVLRVVHRCLAGAPEPGARHTR
jgi:signal transduction histidine kinase